MRRFDRRTLVALLAWAGICGAANAACEPNRFWTSPAIPTIGEETVLNIRLMCEDGDFALLLLPRARSSIIPVEIRESSAPGTGLTLVTRTVPVGALSADNYTVELLRPNGLVWGREHFRVRRSFLSPGLTGRPAASLLIPYFEVDLGDPEGANTLFSVNNVSFDPVVANVVLWTDWGLPTLAFNVFLDRLAIRTLNLRLLLTQGTLPSAGPAAGAHQDFPGCTDPMAVPALDEAALAALRAQHTGAPHPDDGLCYGSGETPPDVAVGYITIDALDDCSTEVRLPGDEGYFGAGGSGLASNRNVLWGDVFLLDESGDSAQGLEPVSLTADQHMLGLFSTPATFYSPWVADAADSRLPLPFAWRSRFLDGGPFDGGTDLLLWTVGAGAPLGPLSCGQPRLDATVIGVLYNEQGATLRNIGFDTGRRTQRLRVGEGPLAVDTPFGFLTLTVVTSHLFRATLPIPVQSWLIPIFQAQGRFSAALHASPFNDEDPP